jgi:Trypsin-co-occurring domain 1
MEGVAMAAVGPNYERLQFGDAEVLVGLVDKRSAERDVGAASAVRHHADDALAMLGAMAASLSALRKASEAEELTVEFNVGFSLKTGKLLAVVSESGADAAFSVKMRWATKAI